MLTEEEKKFLDYWERNRDRQKQWWRQWLVGLPIGLAIAVPIFLNYLSGWYKRATMIASSQFNPMVLIVAVLIIISFVSIFYKKYQWEQWDQRYRELKARESADKRESP
ncbi:hypothetical protein KJS94_06955 [Flavihumibacter rivuli]|uniref:hypothetical protein n=1 Tax=Flavihumibacter rivuli TaxID=2838156 RepID=UPI001BDF13D3|nr:hypothetical protein [Flavihumibacter rivuli]ULQ57937.1 hypothetical protein KJS94_06955 [Flavihumibacter rivuli]